MSDVTPASGISNDTVQLLPAQISLDPRFDVRPFSKDNSADEDKRIVAMALSIEEIGQLDAVLITPARVLVAGHRRRRAVLLINERRSACGQSLLRIRCAVDSSGGDLRRKAIHSNLRRKEASAMDLAYLIVQIRRENSWSGFSGAVKVAEYLGVDDATITQHEKLLSAEKDLQNQIHAGTISAHSALKLLKTLNTPAERAEAISRAAEIQAEDVLDKALEAHVKAQASGSRNQHAAKTITESVVKTRIEHPAIVKAIRERHAVITTTRKLCLTRVELIASISQFDAEPYPFAVRELARYWAKDFASGQGNDEDLKAHIWALSDPTEPARVPAQRSEALAS